MQNRFNETHFSAGGTGLLREEVTACVTPPGRRDPWNESGTDWCNLGGQP